MLKYLSRCLMLLMICSASLLPQAKYLQSGPMVGYSEMMEVLLWVQTNRAAKVKFVYHADDAPGKKYSTDEIMTSKAAAYTAKLVADQVQPGKSYTYELHINGKNVKRPYPLKFQSQTLWQWREDPPPFKLVIGSCAYVNDPPYDRPGKGYGDGFEIFNTIHQQQPDLMIWMGDNVYLREADWYSRTGIFYRYTHTRSLPEVQPLLASTHHYATWDDHDFGPNNSDRSFRNKDDALDAFELFWGNPGFGVSGKPGVTTMFQWADIDFFLMDNRYYRTPNRRGTGKREILGEHQVDWLIDALCASYAPFKVVVMGGQFLNPVFGFENHINHVEEREKLLRAIDENDIDGVIFLSGDRHHSELSKMERRGRYPLYEVTVSPLTAGTGRRAETEPNYLREKDTFVGERNFGVLEFSGPRRERELKISVVNKEGNTLWTQELKAVDLKE